MGLPWPSEIQALLCLVLLLCCMRSRLVQVMQGWALGYRALSVAQHVKSSSSRCCLSALSLAGNNIMQWRLLIWDLHQAELCAGVEGMCFRGSAGGRKPCGHSASSGQTQKDSISCENAQGDFKVVGAAPNPRNLQTLKP